MSKKLTVFLAALVMSLCLFAVAQAEVKQFSKFKAEVPDGWTSLEQQGAVVIMAPDGSAVVTIASGPANGMSAEEAAKQASQALSGDTPAPDGDGWSYTYNVNGVSGYNYVEVRGDEFVTFAVVGDSPELDKILKSIE